MFDWEVGLYNIYKGLYMFYKHGSPIIPQLSKNIRIVTTNRGVYDFFKMPIVSMEPSCFTLQTEIIDLINMGFHIHFYFVRAEMQGMLSCVRELLVNSILCVCVCVFYDVGRHFATKNINIFANIIL